MNTRSLGRKRVNFVIEAVVAKELNQVIPSGERSEFASRAIEKALAQFSREKAYEETANLRKKLDLKIGSDKRLYKIIRENRL